MPVTQLFTVARAAELLSCSSRTVRRRIADGSLPAVLEHDRTVIRADDLAAYLDSLQPVRPPHPRRRRAPARTFTFLREETPR
jgi:excisionase family DNA binding protein